MENLSHLIAEAEKEFDKKFPSPIIANLTLKRLSSYWEASEDIKSFLSSQIRKAVEAHAKEIEEKVKPMDDMKPIEGVSEDYSRLILAQGRPIIDTWNSCRSQALEASRKFINE